MEPPRSGETEAEALGATVRVGTAGWSYEDWNGIVYPKAAPRGYDRLAEMAALFDTNEVNSSFYRIPSARLTRDWSRRVGHNPRFAFTVKLYRGFTHERNAGADERKAFVEAMEPLARDERLGAVLAQFPFSFHNTPDARRSLTRILEDFSIVPLACEFRHESWDDDGAARILADHGAAFVNIDQPRLPGNLGATDRVTSSVAYYRFHGRNTPKWFGPESSNIERYNYLYRDGELAECVSRVRSGAAEVESGARSRAGPGAGVYAILNNHFRGQAVANALEIQNAFTRETRTLPATLLDAYPGLASVGRRSAEAAQIPLFGDRR